MRYYKRIEKINKYSLQDLCIERNWFNAGNAEEYAKLFKIADAYQFAEGNNNKNWEMENIAEQIAMFTNENLDIIAVMDAVAFNCINVFYEED